MWHDGFMDSALQPPSMSIRFSVLVVGFVVHLAAWVGFSALFFTAPDYGTGHPLWVGIPLLVLALIAAAAVGAIARSQPSSAAGVIAAALVIAWCLSGVVALGLRLVPSAALAEPLSEFVGALPFLTILAAPALLTPVTIRTLRTMASAENSADSGRRKPHEAAITLFGSAALIVAAGFLTSPAGTIVEFSTGTWTWILSLLAAVGAVAGIFALRHAFDVPRKSLGDWLLGASGFFTLIFAMNTVIIGALLQIGAEESLVGDGAAIPIVVIGYLAAASVLTATSLAPRRKSPIRRRREALI